MVVPDGLAADVAYSARRGGQRPQNVFSVCRPDACGFVGRSPVRRKKGVRLPFGRRRPGIYNRMFRVSAGGVRLRSACPQWRLAFGGVAVERCNAEEPTQREGPDELWSHSADEGQLGGGL